MASIPGMVNRSLFNPMSSFAAMGQFIALTANMLLMLIPVLEATEMKH